MDNNVVIDTVMALVAADIRRQKMQVELQPLLDRAFELKDSGSDLKQIREQVTAMNAEGGYQEQFAARIDHHLRMDFS